MADYKQLFDKFIEQSNKSLTSKKKNELASGLEAIAKAETADSFKTAIEAFGKLLGYPDGEQYPDPNSALLALRTQAALYHVMLTSTSELKQNILEKTTNDLIKIVQEQFKQIPIALITDDFCKRLKNQVGSSLIQSISKEIDNYQKKLGESKDRIGKELENFQAPMSPTDRKKKMDNAQVVLDAITTEEKKIEASYAKLRDELANYPEFPQNITGELHEKYDQFKRGKEVLKTNISPKIMAELNKMVTKNSNEVIKIAKEPNDPAKPETISQKIITANEKSVMMEKAFQLLQALGENEPDLNRKRMEAQRELTRLKVLAYQSHFEVAKAQLDALLTKIMGDLDLTKAPENKKHMEQDAKLLMDKMTRALRDMTALQESFTEDCWEQGVGNDRRTIYETPLEELTTGYNATKVRFNECNEKVGIMPKSNACLPDDGITGFTTKVISQSSFDKEFSSSSPGAPAVQVDSTAGKTRQVVLESDEVIYSSKDFEIGTGTVKAVITKEGENTRTRTPPADLAKLSSEQREEIAVQTAILAALRYDAKANKGVVTVKGKNPELCEKVAAALYLLRQQGQLGSEVQIVNGSDSAKQVPPYSNRVSRLFSSYPPSDLLGEKSRLTLSSHAKVTSKFRKEMQSGRTEEVVPAVTTPTPTRQP